jgi:hypothetical protein
MNIVRRGHRFLIAPLAIAPLALLTALGCGSVSNGTDAGTDTSGGGHSGTGGAAGTGGGGTAGHGGGGAGGAAGHGAGGAAGTGSAGHGGGGGTGGSAGHDGGGGTGGSAGHDGGTDVRGATCSELASQYADALGAARSCTIGANGQCEQSVSGSLSPCFSNCQTYVNDASTLNALKAQWLGQGCNQGGIACPAIACLQPTKGNCVAADGGGGMCSSQSVLTTN